MDGPEMAPTKCPRMLFDIRGYQAMYRDFRDAIHHGRAPQMTVERAMDDQRLMDRIYASIDRTNEHRV